MVNGVSNKTRRSVAIASLAVLFLLIGALVVTKFVPIGAKSAGPPPSISPTTSLNTGTSSTTVQAPSTAEFNVVSYGADPTGIKDSTTAIQQAIAAAEAQPGSEVYFPAGKFVLSKPSTKLFDFVINKPIHIVGAGIDATTIVNKIGQKTPGVSVSTDIFVIEVTHGLQTGGASGSSISNMTLDSQTYDAGTDIMDFANNTTLSNLKVLAATSTNSYNYNSFGIRVIAICNPSDVSRIYRVNNVLNNITIIGNGLQGTTELDLSCQVNTTATNINIQGNGVDIFYCHNDSITNANLIGGTNGSTNYYTWVITGSSYIALTNINATGIGGVIAPDIQIVSHNISIVNETMTLPSAFLYIGDSKDTTIGQSSLGEIAINPKFTVTGLTLTQTTHGIVKCRPGAVITGLSGLVCTAA